MLRESSSEESRLQRPRELQPLLRIHSSLNPDTGKTRLSALFDEETLALRCERINQNAVGRAPPRHPLAAPGSAL